MNDHSFQAGFIQTAVRLTFWPIFAARALMLLPSSGALRDSQPPAAAAAATAQRQSHGLVQYALDRAGLSSDTTSGSVVHRIRYCCQDWALLWHAALYNLVSTLVSMLSAAGVLVAMQDYIEHFINSLMEPKSASGVPHLPLSLLNLPAPSFNPPHAYFASDFPWTEAAGWTDTGPVRGYSLAHFMSMSARLGYESHELIYRVVDLLWGCEVLGTGQQLSAASPVSWYAFGNCEGVVLTFTGSSALHLLKWSAESPISMSQRSGMGSVSDAITGSLFNLPQVNADEAIFDSALAAIAHAATNRSLYVVGHGTGGALACIFALALNLKRPHISTQVAGVYTFGAPSVGDAAFAERLKAAYSGRLHCYEMAGDVAPLLPPSSTFAPTLPATTPPLTGRSSRSRAAHSRNRVHMLQPCVARSWTQKVMQATLLAVPGIARHMPWEYELALREQVDKLPAMQLADDGRDSEELSEMLSPEAERALAEDPFPLDVQGVEGEMASMGYPANRRGSAASPRHSFKQGDGSHHNQSSRLGRQYESPIQSDVSPTASMMSALSDLRRGEPAELPSIAERAGNPARGVGNRFEGAGWSIGSGRGPGLPKQPEPAPSTVTVPATQYWSVIEGDRRQLSDYEPSRRAAGRTTSLQRTGSQTGSKNLLARQLSGARPQQEEGAPMHLLPASPEGIREEIKQPYSSSQPSSHLKSSPRLLSGDRPLAPLEAPSMADSITVARPELRSLKMSRSLGLSPSSSRPGSARSRNSGVPIGVSANQVSGTGQGGEEYRDYLTLQDFSTAAVTRHDSPEVTPQATAIDDMLWPDPI